MTKEGSEREGSSDNLTIDKSSGPNYPIDRERGRQTNKQRDWRAEEQVLSAAMRGGRVVREEIRDRLHPDMFYHKGSLARVVLGLLEQERRPDPETVKQYYDDAEEVDRIGSLNYTPQNSIEEGGSLWRVRGQFRGLKALEYIKEQEKYLKRGADPTQVQRALENQLMELDRRLERGGSLHVEEVAQEAVDVIINGKEENGIPTGLHKLDRLMVGIEQEDLIIIGGRTSQGKTSLALTWLMNHTIEGDHGALYFSIEGSAQEITERLIRMRGRIEGTPATPEDSNRLDRAANDVRDSELYIDDAASIDVTQVISRARKHVLDRGVDVVYVDYLQLLGPDPSVNYDKKVDRVTDTVRKLKVGARRVGTPIVLITQLNRGVEQRNPPRPRLSDLREGGEDPADKVCLVYRPEHYSISVTDDGTPTDNLGYINLAKHRSGPTGEEEFTFLKRYSLWAPQTTEYTDADRGW